MDARDPTRLRLTAPQVPGPAASRSLAAILPQDLEPTINEWSNETSRGDFHGRFVAEHYSLPHNMQQAHQPLQPSDSSSIAYTPAPSTRSPQQIVNSTATPSLCSLTTANDSSLNTASANVSLNLLVEDEDGVLTQPPHYQTDHSIPSTYECAFWFLTCGYSSDNEDEWYTHCLSHFRNNPPPRSIQCPLCPFAHRFADGHTAWRTRMNHVAQHHRAGASLRGSQPDFHLFKYLWQQRLISDANLQELEGNFQLSREPEPYVVTEGRTRDRRRERRGPR